jgi:hypothetical protein
MTRVTWDDAGLRLYHTGIDRGMLYVVYGVPVAVPWNGLAGVTESPVGGDPTPYYLDGRKILNISSGEDFSATIEAYASPLEFAACAGRLRLSTGLYATGQPKQTFGFAYRTLIGNDSVGTGYAYKIHVIYNATAQIADFAHGTITTRPSPTLRSWNVTTYPVVSSGYRPTSHVVIDSRLVSSAGISGVEAILYGDDTNDARLPTIPELITLLAS